MNGGSGVFVNGLYAGLFYGAINLAADAFAVLLVDETYQPDFMGHTRRSDVTGEIVGLGYHGPANTAAELIYAADCLELKFGGARWSNVDIQARGAIYFRANGGDPSDDELLVFNDFGKVHHCIGGAFVLAPFVLQFQPR
jgi:hypothetical protein